MWKDKSSLYMIIFTFCEKWHSHTLQFFRISSGRMLEIRVPAASTQRSNIWTWGRAHIYKIKCIKYVSIKWLHAICSHSSTHKRNMYIGWNLHCNHTNIEQQTDKTPSNTGKLRNIIWWNTKNWFREIYFIKYLLLAT